MGTTAKGFRYPESTGRVMDGATDMKNLATDVDSRLDRFKAGMVLTSSQVNSNGGFVTQALTFPTAFPAGVVPRVMFNSNSGRLNLAVSNVTNTGCTILMNNWTSGNVTANAEIYWVAIAP